MIINVASIRGKISRSPAVNRKVEDIVRRRVKDANKGLMEDFENHPVTQEIKAGPGANNTSGTLAGQGNLFSFIGFDKGDDPVAAVETIIRRGLDFSIRRMTVSPKGVRVSVTIKTPKDAELQAATPMPWLRGRSWLLDIETGIGGLSNFMAGKFDKSRSGGGIQAKRATGAVFHPTAYMSEILKKMGERLAK